MAGIVLVALGSIAVIPVLLHGRSSAVAKSVHYLSPNGSDANRGTQASPWKSLAYALTRLAPGDVLFLRGGTYYEYEVTTQLKGTADTPITIQSYPGEQAVLDGSIPDFRDAPNAQWESVDSNIGLYRSRGTYSGKLLRAWLVDDDVQLVQYDSADNLESTHYGPVDGRSPLYIGAGVQLNDDGHIYIRLQPNPNDLVDSWGNPIRPVPTDTNPNHNRIAVFTSEEVLLLDGAEYLHFKDIRFSYSEVGMDVRNGSRHIEVDGCRFDYGTYGLVIRDGISDWDIHDSIFDNGLPDNIYWTDVKNGAKESAEAYPEFQSAAIIGSIHAFNIHKNLFHNTFDGLDIGDGTANTQIKDNTFIYVRDDVAEVRRGVSNLEIAHNMLWHVGSGISIDASDAPAGPLYIHHNVIDNSAYEHGGRPGNFRAQDWPQWTVLDPFSSHDDGNKAGWWRIYNNTIITRRSGYQWNGAGPDLVTGNPEKYVYNNIFYVVDDRIVFRDDQASEGSHYDGNVIYRKTPGDLPLFLHFGDGHDYNSLAAFRSQSGTDWEAHGLEIDPGFDLTAIANPNFDSATIWERYRPTNPLVFTPGASYSGLGWPGTEGVNYRGALPPAESQDFGRPQGGSGRAYLPIIRKDASFSAPAPYPPPSVTP